MFEGPYTTGETRANTSAVYCPRQRPRVSPVPETKENENKCLTFVAATLPK